MRSAALIALAAVALGAACSPTGGRAPVPTPSGAPEPSLETIERHAASFDQDVPVRPPGSQEELIAATYVTGHLQAAGYLVRLDSVPVGDLVKSNNLIGVPPGDPPPRVVVVVEYATSEDEPVGGEPIGVFLEVARALTVADPDHEVEFVAVGGQAPDGDEQPGTASLLELLSDDEPRPLVVVIDPSAGDGLTASGDRELPQFTAAADRAGAGAVVTRGTPPGPFARAGFDQLTVAGPAGELAPALFEFLVTGAG